MPSGTKRRFSRILAMACGFALGLGWLAAGAQTRASEAQVEAAYLFNFGKFVRWPVYDPPRDSYDICFVGHDPIAPALKVTALNEHLDNRPVRVTQFDRAADARACAIVFLGPSESDRVESDLAALRGATVLTVSDLPQFLQRGGMIQFLEQSNRIRFAINLDAVNHGGLQLSSELLRVAVFISGAPHGGEARP